MTSCLLPITSTTSGGNLFFAGDTIARATFGSLLRSHGTKSIRPYELYVPPSSTVVDRYPVVANRLDFRATSARRLRSRLLPTHPVLPPSLPRHSGRPSFCENPLGCCNRDPSRCPRNPCWSPSWRSSDCIGSTTAGTAVIPAWPSGEWLAPWASWTPSWNPETHARGMYVVGGIRRGGTRSCPLVTMPQRRQLIVWDTRAVAVLRTSLEPAFGEIKELFLLLSKKWQRDPDSDWRAREIESSDIVIARRPLPSSQVCA